MALDPSPSPETICLACWRSWPRLPGRTGGRRTPGRGRDSGGGGFWLDSIDLLELMLGCDEAFGPVFDGAAASAMAQVATVGDLVTVIAERACC